MRLTKIPTEELLKIASALENGFYFYDGYELDEVEPKFWKARTFGLKYVDGNWCFTKIVGGQAYHKSENNLVFDFDYLIVEVSSTLWALTKEEVKEKLRERLKEEWE